MNIADMIEENKSKALDTIKESICDEDICREDHEYIKKLFCETATIFHRNVDEIIRLIFKTYKLDINSISSMMESDRTIAACNTDDELSYYESYVEGMIQFIETTMESADDTILDSELEKIADNDNQYVMSCFHKEVQVTPSTVVDQLASAIDLVDKSSKIVTTVNTMMDNLGVISASDTDSGYRKKIKTVYLYLSSNIVYYSAYLQYINTLCEHIKKFSEPVRVSVKMVVF